MQSNYWCFLKHSSVLFTTMIKLFFLTFHVFLFLRFFPGTQALGEIYSLACDTEHLITGHTLNTSAFKVWRIEDFEEVKTIKVSSTDLVPCYFVCKIIQKRKGGKRFAILSLVIFFWERRENLELMYLDMERKPFVVSFKKCLCKRDIRRRN